MDYEIYHRLKNGKTIINAAIQWAIQQGKGRRRKLVFCFCF